MNNDVITGSIIVDGKQIPAGCDTKSISILLGAGFSVPIGYPTGNQLNAKLLTCTGDDFVFSFAGELCVSADGTKPDLGCKTSHDWHFDLCKDAILYYNGNIKAFDYEEFYDYLKDEAKDDSGLKELFEKGSYRKIESANFEQYISQIDDIYNHLVTFYLKDGAGKSWYDDEPTQLKPTFDGYTGFLNCIEELSKDSIINVHTLNHDLFFERLNKTEWINGKLCDGFEEVESPFYGKLQTYKCRLSRYTGKYEKKIRLYKLHGSVDQYIYYTKDEVLYLVLYPEIHIKTRWGINNADFYKEIKNENGVLEYENCWVNHHPDFLTGITSKIKRYQSPLLYEKLFKLFKRNLNEAEMLIIIGYGCKDSEINRYLLEEFGMKKPCFIIDPCAGDKVSEFISQMGDNTTLVRKKLEDISLSDFKIR
jgi:hypothetical protein